MPNLKEVAEKADLIVNGYAFEKVSNQFKVLNLNNPQKAVVLDFKGRVIETSMDDIELAIVNKIFVENRKYMED